MNAVEPNAGQSGPLDHHALAVAVIDISADIVRMSHEGTGLPPLPNGLLEIVRVIEREPGISVAAVAARLGRQLSNVSTQLRELSARGLITRAREGADKRYVALYPTEESAQIKTRLESAWANALEGASSGLSDEDRAQIQASLPALRRLAGRLQTP